MYCILAQYALISMLSKIGLIKAVAMHENAPLCGLPENNVFLPIHGKEQQSGEIK